MANVDPKEFRKTIDAEAKRAGLNDEQIKLLYILNGIESRSGTATEYSYRNTAPSQIRNAFGRGSRIAKLSDEEINELKKDDEAFFNFVYAGKIGNGDEDSGDGYKYRGRGGVQLTGKSNYEKVTKILNKNGIDIDLVANPELAADPRYSASILIAFSQHRGMFDPNHKRYISPEDIEAIKNGDIEAIDKLHEITNPSQSNKRLSIQASEVYENVDGEYDISDGSEGNEILTNLGRTDTKTAPPLQYITQVGVFEGEGHLKKEEQEKLDNLRRKGYTIVKTHDKGTLYKYSAYKTEDGIPTTLSEAKKLKKNLIDDGMEDSFIYAEKDGVRIEMGEAEVLETSIRVSNISEKGKIYHEVQIGVWEGEGLNEKTQKAFDKIEESGEYIVKKEHDKGILYKYSVVRKDGAPINHIDDTNILVEKAKEAGFVDAFVAHYDAEGIRISEDDVEASTKLYNENNPNDQITPRPVELERTGRYAKKDKSQHEEEIVIEEKEKEEEDITSDERPYNMPHNINNPTQEMLDAAPKYNSYQEVQDALDNGELIDGDIVNINGGHEQLWVNDGYATLTPHRESDNTFNGGEGGTREISQIIENEEEYNPVEEKEVVEGPKIFKNDEEVLDAMANGDISSTDIIRIEYDDSDPNKPEGEIYEGTVKMGVDTNDDEYVQFLDGTHTNNEGKTNTHKGGNIVSTPEPEEVTIEKEKEEPINIIKEQPDITGEMIESIEEKDTKDIPIKVEETKEEAPERTTGLSEEEQDILDNYSIDGTVGEGKAEIKNSEGETIAYLEGNKLLGKKTIPIIGEQTFEIGEYVKNEDGSYTFKEGKDYDAVMSAASSEDKKVIETFRKAAEDNPNFAEDIINTTEGSETNMSGSDIRTSAITFEPSSEEEIVDGGDTEKLQYEIGDDDETIRKKVLHNWPESKDDEDFINKKIEEAKDEISWKEDDLEYIKENKEHIDKIFAENPEIAAKYEGVDLEDYNLVNGFYDDLYDPITKIKKDAEENEKISNKEETGVFETNAERLERETAINDFQDLENKLLNNTISPEEFDRLEELKSQYGEEGPSFYYEEEKEQQRQRDVNIAAGKGDFTDDELYDQEVEETDLELQRENNYNTSLEKTGTGIRETNAEKEERLEKEKDENEAKYVDPKIEKIEKIKEDKFLELENKYYKEDGTTLKDGMNESDYNKEWEEIDSEYDNEYEKITEKGKEHRLSNFQVEDQKAVWSSPNSELELRNSLKDKITNAEQAIRAAAGNEEEITKIEEEIETAKLALEYLELKNKHGREDDKFDIRNFNEAVENNDVQQLNMWFNDQLQESKDKLEKDRIAIQDGTFEGTEEERDEILSNLEILNTAQQKSELPTEYTDKFGEIKGNERLKWVLEDPNNPRGRKVISGESRTSRELIYLTNIDADDKKITKLNALLKDKSVLSEKNENNLGILKNAKENLEGSGLTQDNMSQSSGWTRVTDWTTGEDYYVRNAWLYRGNNTEINKLKKKQEKGTITVEEEEFLRKSTVNNKYLYTGHGNKNVGILTQSDMLSKTHGHPGGYLERYETIEELDKYIHNIKVQILKTGPNPDVNLSAEQIALFDDISSGDFTDQEIDTKITEIINLNPTAFEINLEKEDVPEDTEIRSMGNDAQQILKGTVDAATGVLNAFGGPDALINAVMGKKALAAAMKDVNPGDQARLSPMFYEHLREAKELSKRGYHPSQEKKFRKDMDTAYQMGLDNSVRGTAGDRAKFLASAGILDSKRSLALLEFASQDAELQQQNRAAYTEMLTYKENFDATQQESRRQEELQMQLANKKAASEFAGLTFANMLGNFNNNSSLIDELKAGMMDAYQNGFKLTSNLEDPPPPPPPPSEVINESGETENEETENE